jgi:thiol-disulfide isomerase/thioredoxin
MKTFILAVVLVVGIALGAQAQNRSIAFLETKVWKEVVEKARAEKKLIFVDCYTDWCGPCKMLAANVFTQDNVADFFNGNFVNAKFEMEKDADGVAHKDVWQIAAFPTLIFVDPETETVVHRLVGAGSAEWLVEGAKVAMNPESNLGSMTVRYEKGERAPEFVRDYLAALKSAYMAEKQQQVALEYLDKLGVEQLATAENWLLMRDNLSDPLSGPLRMVMANRPAFYAIEGLGQRDVDRFLNATINSAVQPLARWQPGRGEFDQARFDALTAYLNGIDFPARSARAWLETSTLLRNGDWAGLQNALTQIETQANMNPREFKNFYMFFIESMVGSRDDAVIDRAIADLDEKIAKIEGDTSDAWFEKAAFADCKFRILKGAKRDLQADNAKLEADDYKTKGQEASGGRAMPAVRMG